MNYLFYPGCGHFIRRRGRLLALPGQLIGPSVSDCTGVAFSFGHHLILADRHLYANYSLVNLLSVNLTFSIKPYLVTNDLSQKISDIIIEDYITQREIEEAENPLDRLSAREREILQLVVEGKSSSDIAQILSLSSSTVDTYRSRLMQKLAINDIPTLVKFAIRHGITSLE